MVTSRMYARQLRANALWALSVFVVGVGLGCALGWLGIVLTLAWRAYLHG